MLKPVATSLLFVVPDANLIPARWGSQFMRGIGGKTFPVVWCDQARRAIWFQRGCDGANLFHITDTWAAGEVVRRTIP